MGLEVGRARFMGLVDNTMVEATGASKIQRICVNDAQWAIQESESGTNVQIMGKGIVRSSRTGEELTFESYECDVLVKIPLEHVRAAQTEQELNKRFGEDSFD